MTSPIPRLKQATTATVEIAQGWMLSLAVIFAEYISLFRHHKVPMTVITLFTLYSWAVGVFHLKDFVDLVLYAFTNLSGLFGL